VLGCKTLFDAETWEAWGWRTPFVLSLALLAISLWMRVKLSESPVYRAMKEEGEISGNPFVESFTYPGNKRRIFVALFGVAVGLTVIWYTATFSSLAFLTGPMRVEEGVAQVIVAGCALVGLVFFVGSGALSDRIGRKAPIVWGYVATLVLLLPLFWMLEWALVPVHAAAAAGAKVVPDARATAIIVVALLMLNALSGFTYGPVAALLSEMFPPRIRYSSMSIPYHFGTGWFGGIVPLVATALVAKTGNIHAGLWYPWAMVLVALVVAVWGLPGGKPRDFADDPA
jgi:MFS family permease